MTAPDQLVTRLQNELGISKTICMILAQRGISDFEEAKQFFRPQLSMLHSPWLMKDMDKAVDRILLAVQRKEKILIFGDYDVDGTTAVAVVYSFLNDLLEDGQVDFYIPHRYREGYGISKAGIDHAIAKGCTLMISLDCGIKSVELIDYARTSGIDFIVCDHHLPGEELPQAVAILNPKQQNCAYPYKELCGCGVGFKLIGALAERFSLPAENCYRYLDLVATAIAADIVPMTGENRVLAYFGLQQINTDPSPGIKALISLTGLVEKLSISNVVFLIAPRVNAAGRMDDGTKAVRLFIEKDYEEAVKIAELLHADNTERKLADTNITEEALALLLADPEHAGRKSSVVYQEHWHKGVVGIVASRLMEHYYRPTVVLTKSGDIVSGSARSVAGFNLYDAIYECREHLLAYGGHFAAAGLSMLPEKVEAFRIRFNEVVSSSIAENMLIPEIIINTELNFREINNNFYNILCQMEPFGPGNMRPVFIARNVRDSGYSRIVKESHIKFVLKQDGIQASGIGFNMADKFEVVTSGQAFNIVFTLDQNEWNGIRGIQLKVLDIRQATHE